MAYKSKTKTSSRKKSTAKQNGSSTKLEGMHFCKQPVIAPRSFSPEVGPTRERLIRNNDKKWVNGTRLNYYFFDSPRVWAGKKSEKDVVRRAFKIWKDQGIGLEFNEVDSPDEAEIRIGFLKGDGSWSYIGRDVLGQGVDHRTMNFGWDITSPGEIDTALHEIGHTLGFHHEHQNPNSGIVWNEEEVFTRLAGAPNFWDRATTQHNIIRKLSTEDVSGSVWDPNSIMHYPFEAGMIVSPPEFQQQALRPAPGLSDRDVEWVKRFYPPIEKNDYKKLKPFRCVQIKIDPGEQQNFIFEPKFSRKYNIATFGESDSVMVLFEEVDGEWRYLSGDDDSGEGTNAKMRIKLFRKRRYAIRVRLFYQNKAGDFALMVW